MQWMPRKVKYRKVQKGRVKGIATSGNTLAFGEYGLQALKGGWLTGRQLEAGRVAIVRTVRKGLKLWIRVFPDKPITKKPLETRMGKGKGNVEEYVAVVKRGKMIYEVTNVPEELAVKALTLASQKLPIPTRIVRRVELI